MNNYIPVIMGMALVTYLPRFLPLKFLREIKLSKRSKLFLQYIPYTSLSILIVRGILTTDIQMMPGAIAGISIAGLIAYWKSNLVLSVFLGIITSFIVISYF